MYSRIRCCLKRFFKLYTYLGSYDPKILPFALVSHTIQLTRRPEFSVGRIARRILHSTWTKLFYYITWVVLISTTYLHSNIPNIIYVKLYRITVTVVEKYYYTKKCTVKQQATQLPNRYLRTAIRNYQIFARFSVNNIIYKP